MRDPKRIDPFLYELGRIWKTIDYDWRFGQLIENFRKYTGDMFYMEDVKLLEKMEYALLKDQAIEYFYDKEDICRFCKLDNDCSKVITGYDEPIYPRCEDIETWSENYANVYDMIDEYLDIREEEGYE